MLTSFFTALVDAFNMYPYAFSALLVVGVSSKVYFGWHRYILRRIDREPATQAEIEFRIRKLREFRPDIMSVILVDLTKIRQEQEIVRIGHLTWLAEKAMGIVPIHDLPPKI